MTELVSTTADIQAPAHGDSLAQAHVQALARALTEFGPATEIATDWGIRLARALSSGSRLLVAGNGGSAAQAQHLSAEIVGRYGPDRAPFSAVALHSEPSALTAILNDYGIEEVFARQVQAHGRPGDICVLMSTSGRSPNMVAAAKRARDCGLRTWAMTGPVPNPLAEVAEEVLPICCPTTATVQELHLVALHLVCEAMDAELTRQAVTELAGAELAEAELAEAELAEAELVEAELVEAELVEAELVEAELLEAELLEAKTAGWQSTP